MIVSSVGESNILIKLIGGDRSSQTSTEFIWKRGERLQLR